MDDIVIARAHLERAEAVLAEIDPDWRRTRAGYAYVEATAWAACASARALLAVAEGDEG